MLKLVLSYLILIAAVSAQAGDVLEGDTLIRTLEANQSTMVLFKNPTGESAMTLVICVPEEEVGKHVLKSPDMGGVLLVPNSTVLFKNDTSSTFADGKNLKGEFIQIECKL